MTVERAGEGAREGYGGSSAAVERGRVRWVVGGGGAGEGAGGRRWRGGSGEGGLARWTTHTYIQIRGGKVSNGAPSRGAP